MANKKQDNTPRQEMMGMTIEEAERMMREQDRGHSASGHGNQGMMDKKPKKKNDK